jgi:ketosteroid isomerase-like protein
VFRGRAEVGRWLRRLAKVGLQTFPDEVVVKGMPWNTTVCVRGRDHLDTPQGERVYENRFVIWGHMKWGRLRDYEVYEDTHRPEALDAYLHEHQPGLTGT